MGGPEKKNPNARENELTVDLMLVRDTLYHNMDAVRERLRPFPHAWRDLKLLWYLVNKTQERLLGTMPDRRIETYAKLCKYGKKIIDIPGPIPRGRHMLLEVDQVAALAEAAMMGECSMCLRSGREIERCPIRDALLQAAPPSMIRQERMGCEYRAAAGDLVSGRDVTL